MLVSQAGSDATTRSAWSEPELTHTEEMLADQRARLQLTSLETAKVMKRRVRHEKEVQRDQDELKDFVDKKMLRIDDLEHERVRIKAERIRVAGERERTKLIRMEEMETLGLERLAKEARLSKQRMEESEAKRMASVKEREDKIREDNEIRRATAERRKLDLLAACERKEAHEKQCMEAKMAEQQQRFESFVEERGRQLEQFREQQERKALEADARVQYIAENQDFNAENTQAKRMSELAERAFKAMLNKKAETEEKRQRSLAKQRKAQGARQMCSQIQHKHETQISNNIKRKAQVSGKMAALRKTNLEKKLEEANILNMNRSEKLERLVARNDYKDSQYLVSALKREDKINGMVETKKTLMHERRLILYEMAQTELKAREELKRIRLRLPENVQKSNKGKRQGAWGSAPASPQAGGAESVESFGGTMKGTRNMGGSLLDRTRAESAMV